MPEKQCTKPCEAESAVRRRIEEKLDDYAKYNLSSKESCLLNILFDLMQEYQDEKYLDLLPVLLLDMVLGLPCELYARKNERPDGSGVADGTGEINWENNEFELRTPAALPLKSRSSITPAISDERVCIPVRGRYGSKSQGEQDREVRGLLIFYPPHSFTNHELLFLEKFANRLGFAMHNSALARRNREHLDFVRNLVKDIGHNVLGPNMYFKLLINKLAASLLDLGGHLGSCRAEAEDLDKLKATHLDILDQINEIQQNFNHSSLFLESLLRESHFIQGCYVLRPCRVNIYERVLKAQFKSHLPMFRAKGIEAELLVPPVNCEANCETEADFGLISQVVANIFSNALKYAAADPAWQTGSKGNCRSPFVRCGVEDDEPGRIRVYILSSGKRIGPEEADRLFDKYYRASNSGNISGTGKGLHFVRDIVTRHGGEACYQATEEGNKFYFSLPHTAAEAGA
ncbi:MAG: HAMP domain-containing histidine kinase [Deltaproteobacteria bacterium]|jgi:signal transduction histidine kinase|nr:HAMP domain-containing histidine kinase [Deltaproteobacteria bacterium]